MSHEENIVYFVNPSYESALIGVSTDGIAVYDYWKMVDYLCITDGMEVEEAVEFMEYNTLRALPYIKNAPVVIISKEDDV